MALSFLSHVRGRSSPRWVGGQNAGNTWSIFGRGSKTACEIDRSDAHAGERMFQYEVFDKNQPARQSSVLLDLRRRDSFGSCRSPERMSVLATGREMILYIAFFEGAHRSSGRSVEYLNGARLRQSLECGRREEEIVCYFKRTPTVVHRRCVE